MTYPREKDAPSHFDRTAQNFFPLPSAQTNLILPQASGIYSALHFCWPLSSWILAQSQSIKAPVKEAGSWPGFDYVSRPGSEIDVVRTSWKNAGFLVFLTVYYMQMFKFFPGIIFINLKKCSYFIILKSHPTYLYSKRTRQQMLLPMSSKPLYISDLFNCKLL